MSRQNAATYLLQTLIHSGVKRIYGLTGDSLNAFADAVRAEKDFEWIHVRHEEVAAFAAGAEAHLTNSLTVCAGSCGPGNLHLINGLYDCHRSRVPVLAIAAQIPTAELGTGFFQETKPEKLFQDCSHFCEVVTSAEHLPRLLKIAIETAVSKRGVSVLIISGDISMQELKEEAKAIGIQPQGSYVHPAADRVSGMAERLNAAKKVTILAGSGCAGAHDELISLAEKLKAPIVHALRGKEHIEYENPYDVGMTGLLGFSSGYHAMMSCDLLLMLGTDFPYTQFYPEASTIQVDERGENIGRRTTVEWGVVGDVRETIRLALPQINEKADRSHLDDALSHYAKARHGLDELADEGTSIHPQFVVKTLSELASDDAVFTCDVGTPTIWAARYLKMNGLRRLVGSFIHGSMANAMPQAIGAQAAFPNRQVISLSGDGGFSMLMGDFLTLNQHNLPVKIIVFNNSSLAFVELEMFAAGLLDSETDLKNPNFAKMAEAVGIKGIRVDSPHDLRAAIEQALVHDGPVLLDVVVNRLELSMPPNITMDQAKGFTLFALKAVISGHGSEVLELGKANLMR